MVTIIINLALLPLRWYSSKKMKKAAKHQPRMKELQDKIKKLKENPKKHERELQQLQQEQMALMKEANPLGGCLPLLLQMPIFWSFFVFLTISLDVRHAPWILWIKDLSTPDPYKILPIVMCITMIAFNEAHAAACDGRPFDEDAARDDDMVYADNADVVLLFELAQRAGALLDGKQPGRSGDTARNKQGDSRACPVRRDGPSDRGKSGRLNKQGDQPRKRKASGKEVVEVVK